MADGFANPGPPDADHESLQLEPAPIENVPTVLPLDTITQPIHLPPPPLGFPTVIVNQSLDPFIIDHLRMLVVPQVILLVMELSNVSCNFSFTISFSRTPTKTVCEELLIEACNR